MNPHTYQYEKIGAAVSSLMAPDASFESKLGHAMSQFRNAFHTSESEAARPHADKIRRIMGDQPHAERASRLTASERAEIVGAFWELDRAVSRDYHTYEARR